ncbi:hypothetical protein PR048_008307 [Dryococelus australis]|uniref:Uncharacterized protein n=1 Tax=Dryococelus australis TaxID=614101 RepID=A0ABQ9HWU5_9NEOP|nr:hypothetical protein PR048_008307 [Dryococelus australis]
MDQRRNEKAGETGDPQENTLMASSGTIPTCENPEIQPDHRIILLLECLQEGSMQGPRVRPNSELFVYSAVHVGTVLLGVGAVNSKLGGSFRGQGVEMSCTVRRNVGICKEEGAPSDVSDVMTSVRIAGAPPFTTKPPGFDSRLGHARFPHAGNLADITDRHTNKLNCSPPTRANRVQSPAGSLLEFRKWESCQAMSPVGSDPQIYDNILINVLYQGRRQSTGVEGLTSRFRPQIYDDERIKNKKGIQFAVCNLQNCICPVLSMNQINVCLRRCVVNHANDVKTAATTSQAAHKIAPPGKHAFRKRSKRGAARECKGERNGMSPRKTTPTSGIVLHDSHTRRSGSDPAGNRTGRVVLATTSLRPHVSQQVERQRGATGDPRASLNADLWSCYIARAERERERERERGERERERERERPDASSVIWVTSCQPVRRAEPTSRGKPGADSAAPRRNRRPTSPSPLPGTMRSWLYVPFWESRECRQWRDLLVSQTSSRLLEFPIRLATTKECSGETGWRLSPPRRITRRPAVFDGGRLAECAREKMSMDDDWRLRDDGERGVRGLNGREGVKLTSEAYCASGDHIGYGTDPPPLPIWIRGTQIASHVSVKCGLSSRHRVLVYASRASGACAVDNDETNDPIRGRGTMIRICASWSGSVRPAGKSTCGGRDGASSAGDIDLSIPVDLYHQTSPLGNCVYSMPPQARLGDDMPFSTACRILQEYRWSTVD